jgi:hypothetical protein
VTGFVVAQLSLDARSPGWAGLVSAGGGFFAGFDFAEEPDQAEAEEAEQGGPAKDVDEGPEQGLAAELLVDLALCSGRGVGRIGLMTKVAG